MITIILSAIILGVQVSPAVENNDTNFEYIEKSNEINTYVGIDFVKSGTMIASWYGPKFHGKQTANTEKYNQMALTAAHKTLPFGTMLRVTNPQNGKQVVVRINDRGPYIKGRDLDLSKGAALQLGMIEKGVIKVEIEKLVPQYSSI
jgi:rare lipoprotein A